MYLTYEEYLTRGGTMDAADFSAAEFRARKRVDWLTACRVAVMETVPEAVKAAMMTIIKADGVVSADAQAEAPLVAAFNTDGYSENCGSPAERTATLERQLNAEVRRLLCGVKDDAGVALLYRGIG